MYYEIKITKANGNGIWNARVGSTYQIVGKYQLEKIKTEGYWVVMGHGCGELIPPTNLEIYEVKTKTIKTKKRIL